VDGSLHNVCQVEEYNYTVLAFLLASCLVCPWITGIMVEYSRNRVTLGRFSRLVYYQIRILEIRLVHPTLASGLHLKIQQYRAIKIIIYTLVQVITLTIQKMRR